MMIFATVFGVGFVMLLFSLLFGSDHDIDHDFDHDVHGDGIRGPSIFSGKMIAIMAVGFGAAGFGVRATTDASMFYASLAGCGGAVVLGVVGYLILRGFYTNQMTSTITRDDVIGQTATVIDTIPPKVGVGQVACIVRGREITYRAISSTKAGIARNTVVTIVAKNGDIVTVMKNV